jgi:DNA-binding transcriptional LysR family regulator
MVETCIMSFSASVTVAPPNAMRVSPVVSRTAPSWDDYRYVQAVAQARSLTGAAQVLGVNHSTVFRRINAIEESFGTQIFERGRSGYVLTTAGEEMVALASRIGEDIVGFERRIAGRDIKPSGDLRVTTNDMVWMHLIAPVLGEFLALYPDIALEMSISYAPLNLSKRDADIAIRATSSPPETLVGRKVCHIGWAAYGPKALADLSEEDLSAYRWIGFSDALMLASAAQWLERHIGPKRFAVRVNSLLGVSEAIQAGVGLGILPCFVGDRIPSLARISGWSPVCTEDLWLLTHPDLKHAARIRAFMDFVWSTLVPQRAAVEGSSIREKATASA